MGRVASCGDNAAMESFFALLQKNVFDRQSGTTRKQLRTAIVTWIERACHRRRGQAALGRLTPVEFETIVTGRTGCVTKNCHTTVQQSPLTQSFSGFGVAQSVTCVALLREVTLRPEVDV